MSRRTRKSEASITLFPFLAVLICTMGSLIVLLVVTVQQAKHGTDSPVAKPPVPRIEMVQQPDGVPRAKHAEIVNQLAGIERELESVRWQTEEVVSSRDKTRERLESSRLTLSRMEDQARELSQQLDLLETQAANLLDAEDGKQTPIGGGDEELAELKRKIEAAKRRVAEAQENAEKRKQQYALVPYVGPYSTNRRPIYIECRANEVILQPEGLRFAATDFVVDGPDNPLSAALRAAREYLLNSGLTKLVGEPYPLLVVRPDGARSYSACRRVLKSWEDEFGYELVSEDIDLAYPDVDAALATTMAEAVDYARQQIPQHLLLADRRPVFGIGSAPGSGIIPLNEQATGPQPDAFGNYGSSGSSDSRNANGSNRPGTGAVAGPGGNSPTPGGNGAYGANGGGWGTEGTGNGRSGGSGGLAFGSGNGRTGAIGSGAVGTVAPRNSNGGGSVYGSGANSIGGGGIQGGSSRGDAYGALAGTQGAGAGSGNGSVYGNSGSGIGNGLGNGTGRGGGPGQGQGAGGSGDGTGENTGEFGTVGAEGYGTGVSQEGLAGNSTGMNGGSGTGNSLAGSSQNSSVGGANATGSVYGPASGNSAAGGMSGGAAGGSSGGSSGSSGGQGGSQGGGGGSQFAGGGSSGSMGGSSGQSGSAGGSGQSMGASPLTPLDMVPPPQPRRRRSIAKTQGDNWALPNAANGAIGITRPIQVQLAPQALSLLPEPGAVHRAKTIPYNQDVQKAIQPFVSTVWRTIEQWGIAGPGVYWKPVLQVNVRPGAERDYEEMAALLKNSGLIIQRR